MAMEKEKEMFLANFEREYKITKRALEAFPNSKLSYKPHKKSRSAKELASLFAAETAMIPNFVTSLKVDQTTPGRKIKDSSIKEIVAEYDKSYKDAVAALKKLSSDKFAKNVNFFGMQMDMITALWSFVMDQIHHRGQFSVYLRLVDVKVPPIYGPTADYPMGEVSM